MTHSSARDESSQPERGVPDIEGLCSPGVSLEAYGLLACMWFAYFLNYCDRKAVFAMFPVLKIDLGMTDRQLGLTGTIFLWV